MLEQSDFIIIACMQFFLTLVAVGIVVTYAINSMKAIYPKIIKDFGQQIMRLLKSNHANAVKSGGGGGGGGGIMEIIGNIAGAYLSSPEGAKTIAGFLAPKPKQ